MKSLRFQKRFYRDWVKLKDLKLTHIIDRETDLQILTNKKLDKEFLKEKIWQYRWNVENYIIKDSRFLTSLKPIEVELTAPPIVQEMSLAAKAVNVGPIASVAGAIAEFLGKDLLKQGYKDVIIENGGDVFMATRKTRTVGIYTGKSKLWHGLKLKIRPKDSPLGICASSGTIGHSLSFGYADSVIIISKNTLLADAAATAVANRVQVKSDLEKAMALARSFKGVLGAAIIFKNNMVSWGKIEFVK